MKTKNAARITTLILTFVLITGISAVNSYAEETAERSYEKVIAHGGGVYKGYETTNSVEALNQAIEHGYKLIELDMELTSDQKVIMLHDWDRTTLHYFGTVFDRKISQSQFLNLTIHGQLEVLTFDKLITILKQAPGIKIVSDTKGDNLELLSQIAKEYPEYVCRIIPQIYDYDELEPVKALGYEDIIFTLYAQPNFDIDTLAQFVTSHDLYAVTMPDYYAERGYCKKLSAYGIKIYVHPVSAMEQAMEFTEMGAYGVYSGTLLPEEFEGPEKDYYLLSNNDPGKTVKLEDEYFSSVNEWKVYGLQKGESVKYTLDEKKTLTQGEDFNLWEKGKHKLTITIYDVTGKPVGQLEYLIWKEEGKFRLLHKKYEYRLDAVKEPKDFLSVMESSKIDVKFREILQNSLIAKKGEHWFYQNGLTNRYENRQESFFPLQGSGGRLLLPLSDTMTAFGAKSVSMNQGKDLAIEYGEDTYRIVVGSPYLRNGFRITRVKNPVCLYLSKAMAPSELYQVITGRPYIERNDLVIFLPKNTKLTKEEERLLVDTAKKLY
ncbi:glycerophosphodiester phosphodiesterase family protein [Sinanaerobacter chloroacetimidivorans]|jgi:glycerophosphoryl diester phosphodiesterase|uniref:GP-PDE domain-containing protein n=1 Tax=Sinanaerobacter chloroacetimidivorans TaxID=2818044 RepID=A0A8J7W1I7_9FIRM|nr:glycerophosphodiester phosphodiesterase family protein [Sinanaerobacter chloroacetimidivorans]MBR0599127.1 hypothetical protein [Sinanaerobacter chloroacetimidivorans]